MKIEDKWFLERYLKKIQSEENSIQVPRHCKTEECVKMGRTLQNLHRKGFWKHLSHEATIATASCALVCGLMRPAHGMLT